MFRIPTNVLIRPGARRETPRLLAEIGSKKVLVVTDHGVSQTEWFDDFLSLVGPHDLDASVEANPKASQVDTLGMAVRTGRYDVVIGVGGGSVLDAAKAASMLARNKGSITSYEGKNKFSNPSIPFVAVPSTCGTGSEVTWVSVISVPEEKRKISVKGDGMFPSYALVDSELIASLPPGLIASTGMDAFTHAIEAVIGKPANPVSDTLALEAMRLILDNLEDATHLMGSKVAKERVMRASTMAGMAFGNADVGAVHCLSESIGGELDLPHGLLNALLLVPVLNYQRAAIQEPLSRVARYLGEDADGFLRKLEIFMARLPLPPWSSLGVKSEFFDSIARTSEQNGSNSSNRKTMAAADYKSILNSL